MPNQLAVTVCVIACALFPKGRSGDIPGRVAGGGPPGYIPVRLEDIPLYLARLDRATGDDGKLALFFPGCTAAAAPFLLFRLKREGYSGCRATATGTGLLLDATR